MEDTAHKHKPESIGEELFLVHLRRATGTEPREEDFDHETPRKRLHDVGEELYQVHLKRSRGGEEEGEDDDAGDKKAEATDNVASSPPRQCRYSLRSQDAAKKNTA